MASFVLKGDFVNVNNFDLLRIVSINHATSKAKYSPQSKKKAITRRYDFRQTYRRCKT
jgi:hypothetical protein